MSALPPSLPACAAEALPLGRGAPEARQPLEVGGLLEELRLQPLSEEDRAARSPGQAPGIQKIRYTHDAMIDLVVANPWISQGELAERFGYTQTWVSIVFSSDAFKNRLEERRNELVDPTIRASIKERFDALVTRSLEVLQAKLSKPAEQVSDSLALKALELGARALNVGAQAPVMVVEPGARLTALAERLTALNAPRVEKEIKGEIIDQAAEG